MTHTNSKGKICDVAVTLYGHWHCQTGFSVICGLLCVQYMEGSRVGRGEAWLTLGVHAQRGLR